MCTQEALVNDLLVIIFKKSTNIKKYCVLHDSDKHAFITYREPRMFLRGLLFGFCIGNGHKNPCTLHNNLLKKLSKLFQKTTVLLDLHINSTRSVFLIGLLTPSPLFVQTPTRFQNPCESLSFSSFNEAFSFVVHEPVVPDNSSFVIM